MIIPYGLHTNHQKAEPLRAASLSKLENTVNSHSIFNTKYTEFSAKWLVLLHLHNATCAYNLPKNLFFYFRQFSPPYPNVTCSQNYP